MSYDDWKLMSPYDEREDRERERNRRRELNRQAEEAEDAAEWDALGATQIIDEHELSRISRPES